MDVVKIGRTIAFLRKQAGMTQAELAQRLYVTDKAVSRWERGVGTPDISLLPKLSAVLDTDIEAVLEGNFASKDADCKGLLIMNYPHNITASTFLYTKRVVYFQLSFFLLAGIREICIRGLPDDVDFTRTKFENGDELGINIKYEVAKNEAELNESSSDYFTSRNPDCPFLIIDGLDFLYGKDITSTLKRLILDSDYCTTLVNYQKKPLSLKYYPSKLRVGLIPNADDTVQTVRLSRGVVSFSIKNEKDLFDAGNIIKVIEEQHGEVIADLQEIVRNRGIV